MYDNIVSYKDWDYYIIEQNKQYGILDKQNLQEILPLQFQDIEPCYYDENRFIAKKDGYYGIITSSKKIIVPFEYDKISNWVEYGPDEHLICKNGKQGLMSQEGKIVIPPVYEKIYVDNSLLIKVRKNGFYGTVNWENKIVHPIQYDEILWEWPYSTGKPLDTIYVKKNDKYLATDVNGKVLDESVSNDIIKAKFEYLFDERSFY